MCFARIGLMVALEEGHVRIDGGCGLAGKECVCKIWHGSGQRLRRYEQGKSVTCDRQTDGQTAGRGFDSNCDLTVAININIKLI